MTEPAEFLSSESDYRADLNKGICLWLEQRYEESLGFLLAGIYRFTSIDLFKFFHAGTTPSRNLLGTICESLNEGIVLWNRFRDVADEALYPLGSLHVGWMVMLENVLFYLTVSNWLLDRNARGYLALMRLDELYLSALQPADRRTLHRKLIAPLFEQAIGRALAWEVDIPAALSEYLSSPLACDILGTLYPEAWREVCGDAEFDAWARVLLLTRSIDASQARANSNLETKRIVEAEERFKRGPDGAFVLSQSPELDKFLYNQIGMDRELTAKIKAQPRVSLEKLRRLILKDGEALVSTAAYEDSFLFFLIARDELVRCYRLVSLGRMKTDLADLASASPNAAAQIAHVSSLFARVKDAVVPFLHRMGVALLSESLDRPSREQAQAKLADLGKAEPVGVPAGSAANFFQSIQPYRTIFWCCTFPLSGAPLHLLMGAAARGAACCYVPSASVLAGLRTLQQKRSRPARALVYSDPSGDLPRCRQEGEWVLDFLASRGFSVTHRTGGEATKDYLLKNLREFIWFHYAGHGAGHRRSELEELLFLADGPIYSSDVVQARAPLELAFLNACWSGSALAGPYGEQTGHANVFLCAGTATVFGRLVPVSDALAFEIAKRWYTFLAEGKTAGEAAWQIHQDASPAGQEADLIYRLHGLPEIRLP